MSNEVKYPDVHVKLTGKDGNAFATLGRVRGALRNAGVPMGEIEEFMPEATSDDYDQLLATCMRWVDVS
jgi:hypothetical protein